MDEKVKKPLTSAHWTDEELREMARDFVSGVPVHTLAEKSNRSIAAVRHRLNTCENLQRYIERFHDEADKVTILALSAARLKSLETLAATGDEMMNILLRIARAGEKDSDRRLAAEALLKSLGVTDTKKAQQVEEKRTLTGEEAKELTAALKRTYGGGGDRGQQDETEGVGKERPLLSD